MSLDNGLLDAYILEYYEALDCSRALACFLLYKYGEHKVLSELQFDPLEYNDLMTARDSLAATKFLSKATFLKTGNDLKEIAIGKFLEAEKVCKVTNERIRSGKFLNKNLSESILLGMTFKIDQMLSDFTPDEFVDSCNWGPGATTLIKRRDATAPNKFGTECRITPEAYDFVKPWFKAAYPSWDMMFEINGESKVVTVPKDAKSDRTIAIEPGINLWFQKGIGSMLKRRLFRAGIDLKHQNHNQEKSRIASKFSDFATVDFSSASDTISSELVNQVLPRRWLALMSAFRSKSGNLDGKTILLEKYSSMGNGFTFELESMLFYTMAVACCDYLGISSAGCSVYGDDVILPTAALETYIAASGDLGFTVNKSKSFGSSYYRESCGAHYWNGVSIKPIFQKEPFDGKTQVLKAANSIRRSAHSRSNYGCDSRLRRAWQLLSDSLGTKTPRVSDGYGDIGLVENIDCPFVVAVRATNGIEGYFVRCWVFLAIKREFNGQGLYLSKMKAVESSRSVIDYVNDSIPEEGGSGNYIPLPGQSVIARKRVLVRRWYDLGPWV